MVTDAIKISAVKRQKRLAAEKTFAEISGRELTHEPSKLPRKISIEAAKQNVLRIGTDGLGERVYTTLTPLVIDLFLEGICRTNNITLVCNEMNISRIVIYAMKSTDPAFRQRLSDAQTIGIDSWEDSAAIRAFSGVERKVFNQGIHIDTVRDYSDSLAIAMLKGAKPERYATRTQNDTVIGGSIGINLETLSDEELNEKLNTRLTMVGALSKAVTLAL